MAGRVDGPLVLIVRDGWGVSDVTKGNAIASARTPRLDALLAEYPHALLDASEHHVGLPPGQMGNSEVGHLNIGAGRVVYQELTRINKAGEDGELAGNSAIVEAMDRALERNRALHLLGLLSDGGVHSHQEHLHALLDLAKAKGLIEVYVHVILDGRDTSPTGGIDYVRKLEAHLAELGVGRIATVIGRFYTMDRDKRWERVKTGYDLLMQGRGSPARDPKAAIQASYEQDITDEFVEPVVIVDEDDKPVGSIRRGDQVLVFNFRGDRARQITEALASETYDSFDRESGFPVDVTTMCEYQAGLPVRGVAFPPQTVKNHITEYLAAQGLSVYKAAETEKYAHVTFFFNGGVEAPCPHEERLLVPSPKVRTYDLQPEMSAFEVTDKLVARLAKARDRLVVLNFANTDMVGHTGVFDAVVRAVEVVDECVGRVCDAALAVGGAAFITADHGNAEQMLDPTTGEVFTAHTTNPVHGLLVSPHHRGRKLRAGALSEIAPTLLEVMGLKKPEEMDRDSLLLPS